MQCVRSKTLLSGLNTLNVDFTVTSDSKDVDFTEKRAKCSFLAARKLKNADFRSK